MVLLLQSLPDNEVHSYASTVRQNEELTTNLYCLFESLPQAEVRVPQAKVIVSQGSTEIPTGQDKGSTGKSNCPTDWGNGFIGRGIGPTGQGNAEVRALQAKVRIP